jgi:hypothetical protein
MQVSCICEDVGGRQLQFEGHIAEGNEAQGGSSTHLELSSSSTSRTSVGSSPSGVMLILGGGRALKLWM